VSVIVLADPQVLVAVETVEYRAKLEVFAVVVLNSSSQLCQKPSKIIVVVDEGFAMVGEGD